MISSVIGWNNLQFVVFEKIFPKFIDTKLQEKSCYYFLIMNLEKKNAESQDRRNFESVRALLVIFTHVTTLQSSYNFAGVLHENAMVFS